jgi:hypothetical protein
MTDIVVRSGLASPDDIRMSNGTVELNAVIGSASEAASAATTQLRIVATITSAAESASAVTARERFVASDTSATETASAEVAKERFIATIASASEAASALVVALEASNVSVAIASASEAGSEVHASANVPSNETGIGTGGGGGGFGWSGPQERVWTTRITCRIASASEASSAALAPPRSIGTARSRSVAHSTAYGRMRLPARITSNMHAGSDSQGVIDNAPWSLEEDAILAAAYDLMNELETV